MTDQLFVVALEQEEENGLDHGACEILEEQE